MQIQLASFLIIRQIPSYLTMVISGGRIVQITDYPCGFVRRLSPFDIMLKRILLADAFFMNTDRHMRNFGVIRSAHDGKVLRLAPNFDNNQAFIANPSGVYSDAMLKLYMNENGSEARNDLRLLCEQAAKNSFLSPAAAAGEKYL